MFEIKSGVTKRNTIILIYSNPGVGKSRLASQAQKPLFADFERGTDFLNVDRIKPGSYTDALKLIKWFLEQPHTTLVIDSISALERMTVEHTKKELGVSSLEDLGFGKGYAAMRANMQRLLNGFEWLRDNGKNIVIIGHAKVKTVTDPTAEAYDRVEFDLDKNMIPVLTSICDGCFYLRPIVRVAEKDGNKKALANGNREIIMSDKGGAISKSRFSHMPQTYEFTYENDETKLNEQYRKFWETLNDNV